MSLSYEVLIYAYVFVEGQLRVDGKTMSALASQLSGWVHRTTVTENLFSIYVQTQTPAVD